MEYTDVSPGEFGELTDIDEWVLVDGAIRAVFQAGSYLAAADFVRTIATIAEAEQHHPDVEVRYPGRVHVTFVTHATSGLTTLDVDTARLVTAAAVTAGLTTTTGH